MTGVSDRHTKLWSYIHIIAYIDKLSEDAKKWAGANRALPDVMRDKSERIASTVGDMLNAKSIEDRDRIYKLALDDKSKAKDTRLSRILQSPRLIDVYIRYRSWGSHYRAKYLENATYIEKNVIGQCCGVSTISRHIYLY